MSTERYLSCFFFSSRRRHTRSLCDWSSDVCSSDLVTGEEEGVGHLAAEPAGHMDELDEPDDRRARDGQALALYDRPLGLDDLRLTVDHEPQGPAHGHHGEGLEWGVERETAQGTPSV